MYNKIGIHKTDFVDKFLLKVDDNTMYVGYIVKEIVEELKRGTNAKEIVRIINESYSLTISINEVERIINRIDAFLLKERKSRLVKLVKIIDSDKLIFPSFIKTLYHEKIIYINFLFTLFVNIYYYFNIEVCASSSILDSSILFFIILFILFLHEIGHSISAKNFKIQTHEIGFGIYIIFPVFYIDLGESWALSRKKRTIINLSGIYTQLIIGIILSMTTFFVKNNFLVTNLFHINFVIILLNFNPFLKFDGYWIISDLINEKDLMKKSNEISKKLVSFNFYKESSFLIIYTMLRLIFIIWVLYVFSKKIYHFIINLSNGNLNSENYILLLLLIFFIYKKLNNEFTRRKKTIY